ncbi:hypothetical protein Abr02nite_29300 [Paractinoplanes brasiliensis]|nr:hypothetical protein Abr02nite_29300 [Actinoplanes brasiliensis]
MSRAPHVVGAGASGRDSGLARVSSGEPVQPWEQVEPWAQGGTCTLGRRLTGRRGWAAGSGPARVSNGEPVQPWEQAEPWAQGGTCTQGAD